jgi:glycosyltransferase involved in cell wall biosynthesis
VTEAPAPAAQQIRVLHLSAGNMIGGLESVLLTLAEYSQSCPLLQQEFALAFDGPFAASIRGKQATVHVLPEARLRNPLSVLRSRRRLRKLITNHRYDAVISHSTWCQVVYGSIVAKTRRPLVFWMHNNFDGHWLQRFAALYPPVLTICNSRFTESSLSRVYPRSHSQVFHYPVRPLNRTDLDSKSLRQHLSVDEETVVILMASRADRWKGHLNLIEAASQIKTKKDWKIWIAGAPQTRAEETYFDSVRAETQRAGLSHRILFLGHRNDVAAVMQAADIFCQPNNEPEPFGIVFVEALQAGVPVVTYRMGGPQEILDANSGILVEPGDVNGLADALLNLIEDGPQRRRLGLTGPARANELCDPQRQIRRLYDALVPVCVRD